MRLKPITNESKEGRTTKRITFDTQQYPINAANISRVQTCSDDECRAIFNLWKPVSSIPRSIFVDYPTATESL